jgi:multidrug efflux pump
MNATSPPRFLNRVRPKMNRLPVASAFLQAAQDIRIGGRGSQRAIYQYTIQSDTTQDLATWGPILLTKMKKASGFQDVNTDQQNRPAPRTSPTIAPPPDASAFRPGPRFSSLYSAFGQSQVSLIYTQLNQYYVVLEVAPPYWQDPSGLNNIYLNTSGQRSHSDPRRRHGLSTTTPLTINHTGLFPSVTVSFNLAPGMSLSDATREIDEQKQRLGTAEHRSRILLRYRFRPFKPRSAPSRTSILTAVLAVYIVLGILYESLVHPITIISTIPSASVGAMLALMIFKIDLNVISIIGIILLIGIVKKNAIMMIDFALVAEREHGKNTADAIFEACMLRFRPILMTTMAALFGALPLAFGTGTGSELRRPLGITIVGGLIVSQLLTLYTTPVIYLFFDNARLWFRGRRPETVPMGTAEAS